MEFLQVQGFASLVLDLSMVERKIPELNRVVYKVVVRPQFNKVDM